MAVRHSVDLVRPYRIFKAIDNKSSYHREEVEVVRVQWSISQIIYLKKHFNQQNLISNVQIGGLRLLDAATSDKLTRTAHSRS